MRFREQQLLVHQSNMLPWFTTKATEMLFDELVEVELGAGGHIIGFWSFHIWIDKNRLKKHTHKHNAGLALQSQTWLCLGGVGVLTVYDPYGIVT